MSKLVWIFFLDVEIIFLSDNFFGSGPGSTICQIHIQISVSIVVDCLRRPVALGVKHEFIGLDGVFLQDAAILAFCSNYFSGLCMWICLNHLLVLFTRYFVCLFPLGITRSCKESICKVHWLGWGNVWSGY